MLETFRKSQIHSWLEFGHYSNQFYSFRYREEYPSSPSPTTEKEINRIYSKLK